MAPLGAAVRAGAGYFAAVLAVAFVLGVIRTLVLEPRLGPVAAVAVELPVVLAWSWVACGLILSRCPVAPGHGARLAMGGVAFGLLMVTELGLAAVLGQSPAQWRAGLTTPGGALGLAGQVGFALVPLVRRAA